MGDIFNMEKRDVDVPQGTVLGQYERMVFTGSHASLPLYQRYTITMYMHNGIHGCFH